MRSVTVVSAVTTALALALSACGQTAPAGNAAIANNAAPASNAAQAAPPAVAQSPKLAKIFTADILGANVTYLETITGPAFTTDGPTRTYKVDGCTVIAGIGHGKIDNIGIGNYGGACVFGVAQYFATSEAPPVSNDPSFGDLQKAFGDGRYSADCYATCGNAAAPVVTFHYQGVHADNFNDLVAQVSVTADPVVAAYLDWTAQLTAKYGQDAAAAGKFPNGDTMQAVAGKDFTALRPTTVRVGQNITPGG